MNCESICLIGQSKLTFHHWVLLEFCDIWMVDSMFLRGGGEEEIDNCRMFLAQRSKAQVKTEW